MGWITLVAKTKKVDLATHVRKQIDDIQAGRVKVIRPINPLREG